MRGVGRGRRVRREPRLHEEPLLRVVRDVPAATFRTLRVRRRRVPHGAESHAPRAADAAGARPRRRVLFPPRRRRGGSSSVAAAPRPGRPSRRGFPRRRGGAATRRRGGAATRRHSGAATGRRGADARLAGPRREISPGAVPGDHHREAVGVDGALALQGWPRPRVQRGDLRAARRLGRVQHVLGELVGLGDRAAGPRRPRARGVQGRAPAWSCSFLREHASTPLLRSARWVALGLSSSRPAIHAPRVGSFSGYPRRPA